MTGRVAIAIALLIVSGCDKPQRSVAVSAANSDQRFDLVCDGSELTNDKYQSVDHTVYRVDVGENTWCQEDCKRLFEIVSVDAGTLTLGVANSDGNSNLIRINRVTGELNAHSAIPGLKIETSTNGSCHPAPFTGFPKTQF